MPLLAAIWGAISGLSAIIGSATVWAMRFAVTRYLIILASSAGVWLASRRAVNALLEKGMEAVFGAQSVNSVSYFDWLCGGSAWAVLFDMLAMPEFLSYVELFLPSLITAVALRRAMGFLKARL